MTPRVLVKVTPFVISSKRLQRGCWRIDQEFMSVNNEEKRRLPKRSKVEGLCTVDNYSKAPGGLILAVLRQRFWCNSLLRYLE